MTEDTRPTIYVVDSRAGQGEVTLLVPEQLHDKAAKLLGLGETIDMFSTFILPRVNAVLDQHGAIGISVESIKAESTGKVGKTDASGSRSVFDRWVVTLDYQQNGRSARLMDADLDAATNHHIPHDAALLAKACESRTNDIAFAVRPLINL